MANYLVTGAAGFIGAAISIKLLEQGNRVVTIDNLSTGYFENIPKGVEFIEGDCANPNIYEKLPQYKYDAILHIAGQSSGEISFNDPIYDIRANAESTLLLLKFALKSGCNRFIYASTMSVYGNKPDRQISESDECSPESFYGVAKLASEQYMKIYEKYGINTTSVRLFNVYGPGQNMMNLKQGMVSIFIAQAMKDKKIHVKGDKSRFRDFIYIDDVTEIFIKCIKNKKTYGKTFNTGTGLKTSVESLVKIIVSIIDKNILVEYSGNTKGDIHGIYANNDRMNDFFSLKKLTPLSQGIKQMIDSLDGNIQ
jgi:UDP-glucose 4-epimerase